MSPKPRLAVAIGAFALILGLLTALWPLSAQINIITFDGLAPTTTQGDLIYRNSTTNTRLPAGTGLQLLRMNSGATAPEWASGVIQEQWQFIAGAAAATWNPADATSYYLILNDGSLVANPGTTVPSTSTSAFYGHTLTAMTLKAIYLDMLCAGASSSETGTIDIRVNNSTNTQILTGVTCTNNLGSGLANNFSNTGLSVALAANDWFVLKFTTPTWATNPTGSFIVTSIFATAP